MRISPYVEQIVGRCHVGWSNRRVLKYYISCLRTRAGYSTSYKGWRTLTRGDRRHWMRQVFDCHRRNQELYRHVMGGHLK